jgi:hypothetical protein
MNVTLKHERFLAGKKKNFNVEYLGELESIFEKTFVCGPEGRKRLKKTMPVPFEGQCFYRTHDNDTFPSSSPPPVHGWNFFLSVQG